MKIYKVLRNNVTNQIVRHSFTTGIIADQRLKRFPKVWEEVQLEEVKETPKPKRTRRKPTPKVEAKTEDKTETK